MNVRRTPTAAAALTALAAGTFLLANAGAASAQTGPDRAPSPVPGLARMHQQMTDQNPGMARMHELHAEGNPGMARMHQLMTDGPR